MLNAWPSSASARRSPAGTVDEALNAVLFGISGVRDAGALTIAADNLRCTMTARFAALSGAPPAALRAGIEAFPCRFRTVRGAVVTLSVIDGFPVASQGGTEVRYLVLSFVLLAVLGASVARPAAADSPPAPFAVTGVDLHDGEIQQFGSTYYLYGTEYGCGFTWRSSNTPWCGFGVATSTDLVHWSAVTTIVNPTDLDPFAGENWAAECGGHAGQIAAGCFNPRMIQRSGWGANDGVFILWFNSPEDNVRNGSNAYNALGCDGPTGPCGIGYPPNGSTHKPSLNLCAGNGDFAVVPQLAAPPMLICTNDDQTLSEEQVSYWGTDGTGSGATDLGGLANVESPGAYFDGNTAQWVLTYSDPDCGYCTGDPTGYALATSLAGPWTAPANAGVAAPVGGRRDISATSCGGQPRTVSVIGGSPFQGIDLWTGSLNEAAGSLAFVPLVRTGETGPAGTPWVPFNWVCP